MKIEIYSDGSDKNEMISAYESNKLVSGFTTNPTLMRKSGVVNYIEFMKDITSTIKDLPISFEVFSVICIIIYLIKHNHSIWSYS